MNFEQFTLGEAKWVSIEEKWPNPLILLAGTIPPLGGKLATFPHSHAGRSNQLIYKCLGFFTLYLILTLGSGGSVRVFLMVNQLPGSFRLCISRAALIMPFDTIM